MAPVALFKALQIQTSRLNDDDCFPSLRPVQRDYTLGQFPTKRFTAMNGAGVTRLYGNVAYDATMQLQFMLDDDDVTLISQCYTSSKGGFDDLDLPSAVFSGMDRSVFPNHLNWRWAETPAIESIQTDLSRVTVSLIATLEVS